MTAPAPPGSVSALILGAGQGRRMNDRAKALLDLDGTSLLARALAAVGPLAEEILVGLPEDQIADGLTAGDDSEVTVIAGGATRHETVARLLDRATRPLVLVHEVARPLAPPSLFRAVLAAAKRHGAATPVLAASDRDALAFREGDVLGAPLPRDRVVRTQTPQAYRREILVDAFDRAARHGWREASVPALLSRVGHEVRVVPGAPDNIKITFPEDLAEAVRLLRRRDRDGDA